jgi:hypothetical protein
MLKIYTQLQEPPYDNSNFYNESNQTAWLEQQKYKISERIKHTKDKKLKQLSARRLSLTDLGYNLGPEPLDQARLNVLQNQLNLLNKQSPCSNTESSLGPQESWSSLEEDSEIFKPNYVRPPRPTA